MTLTEKHYRAERGKSAETYQSFSAIVETEQDRHYIRVIIDNLSRWRTVKEYADYLRWVADEVETLVVD